MKISIVTISFNQIQYLKRCIDSIQAQQGVEFEHIVVDPGSNDGSRDLVNQYPEVVKVFEKDSGPADGLNRGFNRATGDIFCFVNSDDELLPNALLNVKSVFEAHPDTDVLCGCGFYIDEKSKRIGRVAPSRMHPRLYVYGAVTLFQQGMFFRREAFHLVGGFNPDNRTSWDGELFLEMALANRRFRITSLRLASFRLQPESITVSGRFAEAQKADRRRLFMRVCGREKSRGDALVAKAARVAKFLSDPGYLWRRGFGPRRQFK